MNKVIIIGGDHYNALGLARVFGVNGIKSYGILISLQKDSFCYASKYWEQTWFAHDETEALQILMKEFSGETEKPVLVPSSDGAAIAIDERGPELGKYFLLPGFRSEYGKLARLMNKYTQYEWAVESGLKIAQSLIVNFDGTEKKQIQYQKYPCIVKPVISAEGEKSDIKKCNSEADLLKYFSSLSQKGYHRILVQEFLKKDYEAELFGAILQSTDEIPYLLSKHVREWPPVGGSVSYHEFIDDAILHSKAKALLSKIRNSGYVGNIDIELFIIGDDIYLNEVNFRNSGDVYACFAPAVFYPYYSYLDMVGAKIDGFNFTHVKKTYAMNETTDFRHAVYGSLSYSNWIKCYRDSSDYALRFPDDMKPAYKRYYHYLKEFFIHSNQQTNMLYEDSIETCKESSLNLFHRKNDGIRSLKRLNKNILASRRICTFIVLVLAVLGMGVLGMFPDNSLEILSPLNGLVMWFAIFCVLFCLINLFNKEKVPGKKEFSNFAYINLLFTLGMGVGIMVYGFNEAASLSKYPEVHNPIGLCINHWIVIPWAFYVTFAIFEIYDQKYRLIPKWLRVFKIYVYGLLMMLGIGTSFALGVITISNSFNHIYGIDIPSYALVVLLGSLVTISLLRGVHKGMQQFAKWAMILLYVFMAIMIVCAPSDTISTGASAIGSFFSDFIYNNVYGARSVQKDWTVYYWIWWISWAAFTAPFIVTISRGRTIRSVVFYTVIIPSVLITIYMVVGNSIGMALLKSGNEVANLPYLAINKFIFLPPLFILLMSLFYVTSADSMSFAMDNLISTGSKVPVTFRKIMWVMLEVLFVTVLLLAGSGTTSAVQGLSFLFVPLMILIALVFLAYLLIHFIKQFQTKQR